MDILHVFQSFCCMHWLQNEKHFTHCWWRGRDIKYENTEKNKNMFNLTMWKNSCLEKSKYSEYTFSIQLK